MELGVKMKAIVYTKYGPPEVLKLQEVEQPIPKDKQVLIKIHSSSVTLGDSEMRNMDFSGVLKALMKIIMGFKGPRKRFSILGQEISGIIEEVGKDVTLFKEGDSVFGTTDFHFGGYAEYVCLPEKAVILIKPENITYEDAAAVPLGGMEALHFLKEANIQKGDKIIIRGASGSIGTWGIQLAKYFEAEVTAIGNPESLEMMKSIGADKVIDYTKEDFSKSEETYDYIFDVIGRSSYSTFLSLLKKGGKYLLANPKMTLINHEKRVAKKHGKKLIYKNMDKTPERIEQLNFLKELLEAGKLKSVIGKRFTLEQIPEAHQFIQTGNKTGNIVINVVK